MEREDRQTETPKKGGLGKLFLAGLGALLFSRIFGSGLSGDGREGPGDEQKFRRLVIQGWLIVCGMSLAFVAYGFLAFFVIGDKGSPDWDYGAVPDVPAQSTYSTYPFREAGAEPEPQHVDQRPAAQMAGAPDQSAQPSQEQPGKEPGKK
jgi:hypothetical protein